jgi:2-oxoisovalerate dehydrogenase E1 component
MSILVWHTPTPHSNDNIQLRDSMASEIPGFRLDAHGKPIIDLEATSLYAFGHLIRQSEQLILDLFGRGLLSGTTHTCLGQELCQMAVVRALTDVDDAVLSNHRNHGHFLTYSGDVLGLIAEIMGRRDGVCSGFGGSQHIAWRNFHSNGIQAGMTAIGSGLAMARQRAKSNAIVAVIVGDGTLGEGLFYESMNLAATWHLPMLFVVENNGIAQTTYTRDTLGGSIEARGQAFGLRTWRLDDAAPNFVAAVDDVVSQMRGSTRPGMLVIDTRRLGPHSKGDDLRDDDERRAIAQRDPLAALGRRIDSTDRARIEQRNLAYLKLVEQDAIASPEARFDDPPRHSLRPSRSAGRTAPIAAASGVTVRSALNSALRQVLRSDEKAILLGEDIHEPYGGAFKVTAGLSTEFPGRVISTPISEAAITGAAIGLAMAGHRAILEIMFADFMTLCMDQLYNHATKFPGLFPDVDVPLLVRTPCGGRRGYGPTHSQSPENLLVSVPGLTVIYGSCRHDVGRLLIDAAQRWPNPTLFLEHKLLYAESQDAAGYTPLPADPQDAGAELFPTLRCGSTAPDLTLVAFGGMVTLAERAAQRLEQEEELNVEIVVPALLAPMPRRTLLAALMNRPRIAVVEESHHQFGVSAELLATLVESGFRGKVVRLGAEPVPIASARSLERDQLPDEDAIFAKALELF